MVEIEKTPLKRLVDFVFSSQKDKGLDEITVQITSLISDVKLDLMERYDLSDTNASKLTVAIIDVLEILRKELYKGE